MAVNNKYIKGGGLNPFWVDEMCNKIEYEINETAFNDIQNKTIIINRSNKKIKDMSLDEQFNFLQKHNNSKEELDLAKFVLKLNTE